MKTDRELLELAAKAAGMPPEWRGIIKIETDHNPRQWNPLTDDGDALRLAGTLRIGLHWCISGRLYAHSNGIEVCESSRDDRQANLRRAIVRAAAAIGEAMQ